MGDARFDRFAVLILDGYGVNTEIEGRIVAEVLAALPSDERATLESAAGDLGDAPSLLLRPNMATAPPVLALDAAGRAGEALARARQLWERRERLITALGTARFDEQITARLKAAAWRHHYAPWAASQDLLFRLRSTQPTFLTRTAGEDAGYEALEIEIQGNSDTGHQQMFNLCVAEQVSRQLAMAIDEGAIEALLAPRIDEMTGPEPRRDLLVLKTLLSGEFGDDGYVHSCLSHLYAVVDRAFALMDARQVPRERLQIVAALDGRDSPPDSSIRAQDKDERARYDFIGQLTRFLDARGARACLGKLFGRQYMDRNYRGDLLQREIELYSGAGDEVPLSLSDFERFLEGFDAGRQSAAELPTLAVADLDEARAAIARCHAEGLKDSEVPPITIGLAPPLTGHGVFFNLIFRADRQEPSQAVLLGLHDFVRQQAAEKKTLDTWTWLDQAPRLDGLALVSMVDYHAAFTEAGVPFVRPITPHPHNLLALASERVAGFRFLMAGEGVKEKHVGLFARGRRSRPIPGAEERIIFPSYGRDDGIASDDELWRVPAMKHVDVAQALIERVEEAPPPLVAANFPGPDMIGHLVTGHLDACVSTLNSLEAVLEGLIRRLHHQGYVVVLTSDHGNVENFGPDHGVNPVLTSFVPPPALAAWLAPVDGVEGAAKLFDIPPSLLALWGLQGVVTAGLDFPPATTAGGFRAVGRALLREVDP
jgi:bisphosphoglycerate-independent phosphoglycerate mutase (AlkP superfamily)